MDNNSAFQVQQPTTRRKSSKKGLVIIFIVVLLLVVLGLTGLYFYGSTKKATQQPTPAPTEVPVATATPEASSSGSLTGTPAASNSASANHTIKVSVLNGSGTAGAASHTASALKTAGYTSVTTGNADNFNYKGITIHVKKASSGSLAQLQKDINADPSVKVTSSVDDSITTDAEVIVGK